MGTSDGAFGVNRLIVANRKPNRLSTGPGGEIYALSLWGIKVYCEAGLQLQQFNTTYEYYY